MILNLQWDTPAATKSGYAIIHQLHLTKKFLVFISSLFWMQLLFPESKPQTTFSFILDGKWSWHSCVTGSTGKNCRIYLQCSHTAQHPVLPPKFRTSGQILILNHTGSCRVPDGSTTSPGIYHFVTWRKTGTEFKQWEKNALGVPG